MCTDCYNNCGGNVLSDRCVKYTGPDIEFLGIEKGDTLSMLEAALIEQLETVIDGTGITFEDLEVCSSITTALDGEDQTLANVIQAILDVVCELKTDVADLQDDIDPPLSISASCLSLGTNPTRDQILQALATKVCSLNTTVSSISENYVTTDNICALVQECIDDTDTSLQEYSRMPKYVALPYHGPLSVFDSQGRGLESAGYDKVYICNGQVVGTFTTPDYRGRSPIGVNQSLPGGSMDSNVDPAVIANAGYGFVQGTKKGSYTHTLNTNEQAAHSHSVTDEGHAHQTIAAASASGELNSFNYVARVNSTGGNSGYDLKSSGSLPGVGKSSITTTGITLGSSGGGQAHNNIHPVIGAVFIMYIP